MLILVAEAWKVWERFLAMAWRWSSVNCSGGEVGGEGVCVDISPDSDMVYVGGLEYWSL